MDEQQALILRAALLSPGEAAKSWQEFRDRFALSEASSLLSWAAGYVHENLLTEGVSDSYLWGIYQHNLITNAAILRGTFGCIEALSHRTKLVRLKSFARLSEGERLGTRPLADIDVLISPRALSASVKILSQHGFSAGLGVSQDEFWDRVVPQRSSWGFENSAGNAIDLHWRVFHHASEAVERSIRARVQRLSDPKTGHVSVLNRASEVVLLSIQQRLQFQGTNHLLIDIWRLCKNLDMTELAAVADAVGCRQWVDHAFQELSRAVGHEAETMLEAFGSRKQQRQTALPPHNREGEETLGDRVRGVRRSGLVGRPRALPLWLWSIFRRSARLETLLLATFGRLSPLAVDPIDSGHWCFQSTTENGVDAGWTFRVPGQRFVWARYPEGRIRFRGAHRGRYLISIQLQTDEWLRHPLSELSLFINGTEAKRITKSTSEINVEIENTLRGLEFSFRRRDPKRFVTPGIFREWYEQMVPLEFVSVRKIR